MSFVKKFVEDVHGRDLTRARAQKYSDDQARDDRGRWTGTSGTPPAEGDRVKVRPEYGGHSGRITQMAGRDRNYAYVEHKGDTTIHHISNFKVTRRADE